MRAQIIEDSLKGSTPWEFDLTILYKNTIDTNTGLASISVLAS